MSEPSVVVEQIRPEVSLVRLNRPDRLNALNLDTVVSLRSALDEIAGDAACRVVILTGAGRGFCAGLDLKGAGTLPGTEGLGRVQAFMRSQQAFAGLVERLRSLPQPVIAAVNGPASGAGFALALGSDLRVASETARFNVAPVRIGLSGGESGISYLLPRIVGATRAFELMLTGRLIDAAEASRIGLVLEVVPDGQAVEAALMIAEQIRGNSPFGVWMTKEVMWANLEAPSLRAAIDLENRTQILSASTEDAVEAVRAFLEKRDPHFENR